MSKTVRDFASLTLVLFTVVLLVWILSIRREETTGTAGVGPHPSRTCASNLVYTTRGELVCCDTELQYAGP